MTRVGHLILGLLLALVSVAAFASTFVFGAALTKRHGVDPLILSSLRFILAGAVLFGFECTRAQSRARLFSLTKKDWLNLAWVGPIGTCVMAWCVFKGCSLVSTANASMADALTPLMIFVVGALRTRHMDGREWIGLICGFIGVLLVIQIVTANGVQLEAYSWGDVFVFFAALTWGIYTVYGRAPIARMGSSVFSTWTMLIGGIFAAGMLPFVKVAWPATPEAWLLIVGLGLVATLLPFWTWNAAQKYLPMSVLGVSAYFTPVFAVGLAILFLNEHATGLQWLGTFFIIASALVETGRTRKLVPHTNERRPN